jgi:hypothetical protein
MMAPAVTQPPLPPPPHTKNSPGNTDPEMPNANVVENFLHHKDVFPKAEVVYYCSVY